MTVMIEPNWPRRQKPRLIIRAMGYLAGVALLIAFSVRRPLPVRADRVLQREAGGEDDGGAFVLGVV